MRKFIVENGTRLVTSDGLKLYTKIWAVDNPRAIVILVHGLAEHIGRYSHVAEALNAAGYTAVGLDHRGHGKSEGQPRAYVRSIDTYVNDLKLFWDQIKSQYPELPFFIIGQSMGGLITTRFVLRYQDQLKGAITASVALAPGTGFSPATIFIGKYLGKLLPFLPLARIEPDQMSRDKEVVKDFAEDPLNYHKKGRFGMGAALLSAFDDTLSRLHTLQLPVLILYGSGDMIVDPKASQMFYEKAGTSDKTLKMYPDLYHDLIHEPEHEEILSEMVNWLDKHLG